MKDEIFDRKIKELADSYSEAPAPELWARIESGLDRRRRIVRWRKVVFYAAAAAVVAGFFVTAVLYPSDPMPQQDVLAVVGQEDVGGEDGYVQERIPALTPVRPVEGRVLMQDRLEMSVVSRPADAVPRQSSQSDERIGTVALEVRKNIEKSKPSLPSIYDKRVQMEYIAMAGDMEAAADRKASSFSIAASGHLSPTDATGNVDFSQPSYSDGGIGATPYGGGIVPVSEPRHYFPVSLGLEIRYSFLNDRLGVGLGVNYTFLNSRYEALVDRLYQGNVEQSIHYIGVPLNFYVNILSGKRLTFYANAGCMVERAVRVDYDITDLYGIRYRKSLDPVGVQWSANVGIGLEYRIWDFMGIYVDPRLTYFFDCDQPYSVRTEQPLQFNLELGFRFHI